MDEKMIAVCGLDCGGCPIHKASLGDVEAAQLLVGWWKGEGWLKEDEGVDEVLALSWTVSPCPLARTKGTGRGARTVWDVEATDQHIGPQIAGFSSAVSTTRGWSIATNVNSFPAIV
jgi:hypothetical protein